MFSYKAQVDDAMDEDTVSLPHQQSFSSLRTDSDYRYQVHTPCFYAPLFHSQCLSKPPHGSGLAGSSSHASLLCREHRRLCPRSRLRGVRTSAPELRAVISETKEEVPPGAGPSHLLLPPGAGPSRLLLSPGVASRLFGRRLASRSRDSDGGGGGQRRPESPAPGLESSLRDILDSRDEYESAEDNELVVKTLPRRQPTADSTSSSSRSEAL